MELLACRVCLATNIKLYDMRKHKLSNAYESITGISLAQNDNFPVHMCAYCSVTISKFIKFKEKCLRSQKLLEEAALHHPVLTTDYIRSIDRVSHQLTHSCKWSSCKVFQYPEIIESSQIKHEIKEEISNDSINYIEVYQNSSSYEEPPTKKAKAQIIKKEQEQIVLSVKFEPDNDSDSDTNNDTVESESNNDIEVVELTREQKMEEILARKNSCNYLNSLYKCNFCFKGFLSDVTYKNHMARHDPASGRFNCEFCQTKWLTNSSLRHHMKDHEKRYICRICNHVSNAKQKANEHLQWHQGYTIACETCGASFTKKTSYLSHVRLNHPSKHCCDVCGESFIGEFGLTMHKKKSHKNIEQSKSEHYFQCEKCTVQFKNKDALKRHLEMAENGVCDTRKACVQCGDSLETDELLKEHLKLHHKDNSVTCEECNRTFTHQRSFEIHWQRVHMGIRLKNVKPYVKTSHRSMVVCEVCGLKCNSTTLLANHQRTHTGEKPYECTECPKTFRTLQLLQIHQRTHTGETPFQCVHCPKAFKQKAGLVRHDRIHTGVKPYKCTNCDKSFTQSNSLKSHVRTVHEKIPAPPRSRRGKGKRNEQLSTLEAEASSS